MSFKGFLFSLVLVLLALWAYLYFQTQGSPASRFNQTTRFSLGKREWVRKVLNLHNAGDARAEYFKGKGPIVIEVVNARSYSPGEAPIKKFSEQLEGITGQKTQIYNVDVIENGEIKISDMPGIVERFRRHKNLGQPNLFVVYAEDFNFFHSPAAAFQEYGVLVSHKKLAELTKSNHATKDEYLTAFLMYHFGLQIGLTDSSASECVMRPEVLKPAAASSFSGSQMPTKYCREELEKAEALKARY